MRALEDLLVDRLRVLGPEHRDIAATRKRIAYRRAGQVRYYLRWRAADGSEQSMGPFAHAATARQAGAWAERGGGTRRAAGAVRSVRSRGYPVTAARSPLRTP